MNKKNIEFHFIIKIFIYCNIKKYIFWKIYNYLLLKYNSIKNKKLKKMKTPKK